MSDSNTGEYDKLTKALEYGTISTNSLFDSSPSSLKISRAGGLVTIRIPWVTIIWGGIFGIIGLAFAFLLTLKILHLPGIYLIIMGVIFGVIPAFIGAKLGQWSPMRSETGEDLITYLKVKARQKISAGSAQKGKQSTCQLLSKAVGGDEGRVVNCTMWIGTQPLYDAPPQGIYANEVHTTNLYLEPRGHKRKIPTDIYDDGLGDRF